jgi:uncharacterized protein YbaP (TraB family)
MQTAVSAGCAQSARGPIRFLPVSFFALVLGILFLAAPATAGSLLWEVKSPTATVYLLGSIHFAKPDMYPLDPAIEDAFRKSSSLVLELNPLTVDQAKLQQEVMARGMYPEGKTIRDDLSDEVYGMLKEYLKTAGLPSEGIMKMKPAIVAMTISSLEMVRLGYDPNQGIDIYFAKKAGKAKPILELESVREQLEMLFNMPDQNLFMKYTIMDISKSGEMVEKIVQCWKAGDAESIDALLVEDSVKEDPSIQSVLEEVLYKRNRKMAEKIKGYLGTNKSYFVVIGAAHLVGRGSVVDLIGKAGYRARKF